MKEISKALFFAVGKTFSQCLVNLLLSSWRTHNIPTHLGLPKNDRALILSEGREAFHCV